MIESSEIWFANTADGTHLSIDPKMANRHGLIAGATGTGKTVTLKVLAERFSALGVPVFLADVKGDITGLLAAGEDSADMQERIARFGLAEAGFSYQGCPGAQWDIYGKTGIQLRTTISEMGPLLLSRVLGLNELQSGILSIVFKIADDNDLLLIDTKDLKSLLHYVSENASVFAADYGKISSASVGVITRALVALEAEGGDVFFGEPALNIIDFFTREEGRGVINILDSSTLINNTRLYSTFLLWLMSELFEQLPEVGDQGLPKLVFFFDEAHLLFKDTPKALLEKIEQMVKLIRSKGVGVYFCTQNPKDIPDGVLSQLGNKIEHGLRAYTPADQKAVRAAAAAFRENPAFDTYDTILNLGTGEAVVSVLGTDGIPGMAQKAYILPPQCAFGVADKAVLEKAVQQHPLYQKYAESYDPDSAYEFLQRRDIAAVTDAANDAARIAAEKAAAKEAERLEKEAIRQQEKYERDLQKEREREMARLEKERQKEYERMERARQRDFERVERERERARTAQAERIGREIGKSMGSGFGSIGRRIGSDMGAQIGRGLLDTFLRF